MDGPQWLGACWKSLLARNYISLSSLLATSCHDLVHSVHCHLRIGRSNHSIGWRYHQGVESPCGGNGGHPSSAPPRSVADEPSRSWMRESCGAYAAIEAGGECGVGSRATHTCYILDFQGEKIGSGNSLTTCEDPRVGRHAGVESWSSFGGTPRLFLFS
jgi:hypothetical protein